ncbi:MAG: hypothetical protein ABII24_01455 [bacterium]
MKTNTNTLILLVAVVLGFTSVGCIEIGGPGGLDGSEVAYQNCSGYTAVIHLEKVYGNGQQGHEEYTYDLAPRQFGSNSPTEGKYRVKVWAPTRNEWISCTRYLYVPVRGGERDVPLVTTLGMDPVYYSTAIVIYSNDRGDMWAKVLY